MSNNPYYLSDPPDPSQIDPGFSSQGQGQGQPTSRILGPQQYSDGVSFWYNTEEMTSVSVRRPPVAPEQVKHRRTRSGCYTCRSRRVKCDEVRPICDRCRKGNRDCVYPEPPSSKGGIRTKATDARTTSTESGSSSNEEEEGTDSKGLETIVDDEEESALSEIGRVRSESSGKAPATGLVAKKQSIPSLRKRRPTRLQSETSSSSKEKSISPSTEGSSNLSATQGLSLHGQLPSPLASEAFGNITSSPPLQLSEDIRFYLKFHQENLTHHHYFLKSDPGNFIKKEFVDLALKYEPLLFALVGFSAYHYTLRQPDGKVQNFLQYYNRSVSKLRRSLLKSQQHDETIILTILQLATFEEYLGDWVNLVGHQRAAHHLLIELYTPETIMQSDMRRQLFTWYSRFDIVVGLLGGNETRLGREWYLASEDFHDRQAEIGGENVESQLLSLVSKSRIIGVDMAMLFAQLPRGTITMDQFHEQNKQLGEKIWSVRQRLEELSRPEYAIFEFPNEPYPPEDSVVNPYLPGGLFKNPYFTLNFSWSDWHAIHLMHKYQTALTLQQDIPIECEAIALEQCRILEAIEKYPDSPAGSLLAAHASLGIASLFLRKDEQHTMWLRRKLATMEQLGYIYPPTFRSKMAELWQVPEISHWWLPNDEGYPPIIRSIRSFIEERATVVKPGDHLSEDLQSMKAIFSKLNLDDSTSQRSSPSTSSASDPSGQSPPGPPPPGSGLVQATPGLGQQRGAVQSKEEARAVPTTQGYGEQQEPALSGLSAGDRMSGIWEPGVPWPG